MTPDDILYGFSGGRAPGPGTYTYRMIESAGVQDCAYLDRMW